VSPPGAAPAAGEEMPAKQVSLNVIHGPDETGWTAKEYELFEQQTGIHVEV